MAPAQTGGLTALVAGLRRERKLGLVLRARGGVCPSCCSIALAGCVRRRRAGVPCGAPATEQRAALAGRSAEGGGDRCRDARGWRRPAWLPVARVGRRVVASRLADPGSALARRSRPRPAPRLDGRSTRQRRATSRGRHGRVGVGQLPPWLDVRLELAVGPLFCIVTGPTCGRPASGGATPRTAPGPRSSR